MDQRAIRCAVVAGGTIAMIVASGCGADTTTENQGGGDPGVDAGGAGGGDDNNSMPTPKTFTVSLVPDGASGAEVVNFAIPFARGVVMDANAIKVSADNEELPAAHKALASHSDGSVRSVQLQVNVDAAAHPSLTIELGVAGIAGPDLVPVTQTLTGTGNNIHPKVWAVLPTDVLAASGFAGPVTPRSQFKDTALDAWTDVCDYDHWDTASFLVNASASRDVWLYDRVTAMLRGYVMTGEISPLRSAYREAGMYLGGMTISNGAVTAVAPPTANGDLKYYYSQGMALHYLLTGDERYREAAEAVSQTVAGMWNPEYDGGDRFWTERNAGFALLAHEWALAVTDDKAQAIAARSERDVTAYLAMQNTYPVGYTDQNARCFAHSAEAHGEDFGTFGCSPWMSAILADGLDAYARRVGGDRAKEVRASLVKLGNVFARDALDSSGKPYYWMGMTTQPDEVDDFDEHWGETAYILAMAWDAGGRTDAALKAKAEAVMAGMRSDGEAFQVRSFNWQCRSAIMTPTYLK
jgi:hypothetical protein